VTEKSGSVLTVTYDFTGVKAAQGGLHIHTGTSCNDAANVGGHYWLPSTATDPWLVTNWAAVNGKASGTFDVSAGLTLSQVMGRAVVVHDGAGARIACGVIMDGENAKATADIFTYPGYTGTTAIRGSVQVDKDTAGMQRLTYDITGAVPSSSAGLHIHTGTSCADAAKVGGHFWTPSTSPDPWGANTMYTADANGVGKGTFSLTSGYTTNQVVGRAVVLHEGGSPRVGCGVICSHAKMSAYPGYQGSLSVFGSVRVGYAEDGNVEVGYSLGGLEASAVGQVHIHAGMDCANSGGHYWNSKNGTVADPWTKANYPMNSNAAGVALGSFTVPAFGYELGAAFGHAVVVHSSDGTRIACGVLSGVVAAAPTAAPKPTAAAPTAAAPTAAPQPTPMTSMGSVRLGAYPGYKPGIITKGNVVVTEKSGSVLTVTYDFTGVKAAQGGLHIHTGTSCNDAANVGGHYWLPSTATDPWLVTNWAAVNGKASGTFDVSAGLTLSQVMGRAVVVHDGAGARIACGVIMDGENAKATADIFTYPGYTGTTAIRGSVQVDKDTAGMQRLTYDITGAVPSSSAGLHIHTGTSCADAAKVGGHFWTPSTSPDPWGANTMYTADANGVGKGTFSLTSGYTTNQVVGRAVVLHEGGSPRVGCGVICSHAKMSAYPGYQGSLSVFGSVRVGYAEDGNVEVGYSLGGLEASAVGQVHIHAGMDCANSGGHYWNSKNGTVADPWTKANYPMNSNAAGVALGSFTVPAFGYELGAAFGHAVVVHSSDGTRIACGVLSGVVAAAPTAAPKPTAAAPTTAAPTGAGNKCSQLTDIKDNCEENYSTYCGVQYANFGEKFCKRTCCLKNCYGTCDSVSGAPERTSSFVNLAAVLAVGVLFP